MPSYQCNGSKGYIAKRSFFVSQCHKSFSFYRVCWIKDDFMAVCSVYLADCTYTVFHLLGFTFNNFWKYLFNSCFKYKTKTTVKNGQ